MVSFMCCEQGPAWEAQCHADTHLMLSTLQALPLDPETASSTMDHLAKLCTLRFADPSPSGYTIPGQLPSPVSYSSLSQASTPGTAASGAALINGAPHPSAGRQLEKVCATQHPHYRSSLPCKCLQLCMKIRGSQMPRDLRLQVRVRMKAYGSHVDTDWKLGMQAWQTQQQASSSGASPTRLPPLSPAHHAEQAGVAPELRLEPVYSSQSPAASEAHALHSGQSAGVSMPAVPSVPSEDVLNSEGLTSAALDESAAAEQQLAGSYPMGSAKLPAFAQADRHLSSQQGSPQALAGSRSVEARPSPLDLDADPLGATVRIGRRSTDASPAKSGAQRSTGWSPSRSSAGSSPARQHQLFTDLSAPGAPQEIAFSAAQPSPQPAHDVPSAGSWAAEPHVQSEDRRALEASSGGGELHGPSDKGAGHEASSAGAVAQGWEGSASTDIRQLTREISELAYIDRDPVYGSPVRRYRPTDDAEEPFVSSAAPGSLAPSSLQAAQEFEPEFNAEESGAMKSEAAESEAGRRNKQDADLPLGLDRLEQDVLLEQDMPRA